MRNVGSAFALTLAHASAKPETARILGAMGDLSADDGVERDATGVPVAFRIWKAGLNVTDHGDHYFTPDSARKILAQQAERGNLYSFDVDHMSLNDQAPPENHKAVGAHRLAVRDGELWAVDVQFTRSVRDGVTPQNPEWRYFSPAYDVDTKTGEIARYINTALTNNPATHNVTALATVATAKETAMADEEKKDEKKEETLGAMLAAYEAEPSDEKRSGMRKDILAKFAAEFPPEDDKKDEKKETKKADVADGDSEKKEAKKAAAGADDSEKHEKVSATIAERALEQFEAKRIAREEKAECDRILAALPAGDRETYKDLTLAQLQRVVKRHHAAVLTDRAAAGTAMPVRGATQGARASMLPAPEREALDEAMGIRAPRPFMVEKGTRLEIDPMATPEDARRFLAAVASERKTDPKMKESEALSRVLANQKGAV